MVLSAEHCWIREPEVPTLHQRFWTVSISVLSVNHSSALKWCLVLQTKRYIYGLQIRGVDGKFTLEAEVNKVDRKELLTLENPKCAEIVAKFSHLKGVNTNDNDEKHSMKRQI